MNPNHITAITCLRSLSRRVSPRFLSWRSPHLTITDFAKFCTRLESWNYRLEFVVSISFFSCLFWEGSKGKSLHLTCGWMFSFQKSPCLCRRCSCPSVVVVCSRSHCPSRHRRPTAQKESDRENFCGRTSAKAREIVGAQERAAGTPRMTCLHRNEIRSTVTFSASDISRIYKPWKNSDSSL